MYIISSGSVEVVKAGQRLAQLGVGDCFGEMALLDRETRSATIRSSADDTRLVAIAREDFYDLLELYPSVSRAIAKTLVERLRRAME